MNWNLRNIPLLEVMQGGESRFIPTWIAAGLIEKGLPAIRSWSNSRTGVRTVGAVYEGVNELTGTATDVVAGLARVLFPRG